MDRVNLCVLQRYPHRFLPLIVLPGKSFNRIPTNAQWNRFKKRARGMRELRVHSNADLIAADVPSTLQLRNGNDQFLPRLETFACLDTSEAFIPLIPLFLHRQTANIVITFSANVPVVMMASTIAQLPVISPNLRQLVLSVLPKDPVIVEAASEMLLACSPDSLEEFMVYSPLTEEACRVLYNLPNLRTLRTIVRGPTPLPPLTLPSLTTIRVSYDDRHNWLRGFHGATLGSLLSVSFSARPASIGPFLEDFKSAALTSSIQNTLSSFEFLTQRPWNPDYSSLLVFKQLTRLVIEFSCSAGCSSGVDDDVVTSLAHAMPKLEVLYLGGQPCQATTGITLKGLVTLACRCPKLSKLRVHFRVREWVEVANNLELPVLSAQATIIPKTSCALTCLQVGETPILERDIFAVALILVQVFPQINSVLFIGRRWEAVEEYIRLIKQIGSCVDYHMGQLHIRS